MTDFHEMIFKKANMVVPGVEYNRFRQKYLNDDTGQKVFFEIVLSPDDNWSGFRDKNYPTFVRYLKEKSIDPEYPEGVLVAIFFKDLCYLLEGEEFLNVLKEMEGLNNAALYFRILQWLSHEK